MSTQVSAGAEPPGLAPKSAHGSGRPLDARRDTAILGCALKLVAEVGYDRFTIEAVAQRCRASKATIYRRWDSKATLIVDAVKAMKPECLAMPVTGDVRADLITFVSALTGSMQDAEMRLVVGLLAASRSDPELAAAIQDKLVSAKRDPTRDWIRQQIVRGAVRSEVSEDLLFEIVPAMIFARLLVTAEPLDNQFLVHLVDDILLPLLSPTAEESPIRPTHSALHVLPEPTPNSNDAQPDRPSPNGTLDDFSLTT